MFSSGITSSFLCYCCTRTGTYSSSSYCFSRFFWRNHIRRSWFVFRRRKKEAKNLCKIRSLWYFFLNLKLSYSRYLDFDIFPSICVTNIQFWLNTWDSNEVLNFWQIWDCLILDSANNKASWRLLENNKKIFWRKRKFALRSSYLHQLEIPSMNIN